MFDDTPKFKDYEVLGELGKGAQGKVYKVKWHSRKREIIGALKFLNSQEFREVLKEVSNWARVSQHPNVLTFITADEDNGRFFTISELAAEGDLEKWIEEKGGKEEFFDEAFGIMLGILQGLKHLHENEIVHRDIKPANIFLKDKTPLLADFGLARGLNLKQSSILGGTLAYMSSELINVYLSLRAGSKSSYERTEQDDLWAVAANFQYMLMGKMPFDNIDAIRECQPNPLAIKLSPQIKDFLKIAFAKDKDKRFQTAEEMIKVLQSALNPSEFVENQISSQDERFVLEDLDKTEKYDIAVTEDWREIEAKTADQPISETPKIDESEIKPIPKDNNSVSTSYDDYYVGDGFGNIIPASIIPRADPNQKTFLDYSKWIFGGIIVVFVFTLGIIGINSWKIGNDSNTSIDNKINKINSKTDNPSTSTTTTTMQKEITNSIGMEFVKIPSGSFTMGSPISG